MSQQNLSALGVRIRSGKALSGSCVILVLHLRVKVVLLIRGAQELSPQPTLHVPFHFMLPSMRLP